jgi:hypothetical protein
LEAIQQQKTRYHLLVPKTAIVAGDVVYFSLYKADAATTNVAYTYSLIA